MHVQEVGLIPLNRIVRIYRYWIMCSAAICCRGGRAGYTLALATLLLLWQPWAVNGIEFDMVFQTKCVYEEVVFESSALMTFHAFQISNPEVKVPLNIRVHDQEGTERFARMDAESDKFNLPGLEEGRYKICFTAKSRFFFILLSSVPLTYS